MSTNASEVIRCIKPSFLRHKPTIRKGVCVLWWHSSGVDPGIQAFHNEAVHLQLGDNWEHPFSFGEPTHLSTTDRHRRTFDCSQPLIVLVNRIPHAPFASIPFESFYEAIAHRIPFRRNSRKQRFSTSLSAVSPNSCHNRTHFKSNPIHNPTADAIISLPTSLSDGKYAYKAPRSP